MTVRDLVLTQEGAKERNSGRSGSCSGLAGCEPWSYIVPQGQRSGSRGAACTSKGPFSLIKRPLNQHILV